LPVSRFANSTNCLKSFAGLDGLTSTTSGWNDTAVMKAKSFCQS